MLTTAMLTQLNELRRKERCVFFVATNRISAFDSAVTRPGRFDMMLLVGTPSLRARLDRLDVKLAGCSLGAQDAELREVLAGVLKDTWSSELQFFNFMESEKCAPRRAPPRDVHRRAARPFSHERGPVPPPLALRALQAARFDGQPCRARERPIADGGVCRSARNRERACEPHRAARARARRLRRVERAVACVTCEVVGKLGNFTYSLSSVHHTHFCPQ